MATKKESIQSKVESRITALEKSLNDAEKAADQQIQNAVKQAEVQIAELRGRLLQSIDSGREELESLRKLLED